MSKQNREKLNEIVSVILGVEPDAVDDDLSPEKVEQWDSLNHLNLCVALGQEFSMEMTTDEIASIRTMADVVKLLKSKGIDCD